MPRLLIVLGLLAAPSLAVAQDGSPPGYFAGAQDALPLTQADASSLPPQAGVLRWKSPAPQQIINPYVKRSGASGSVTATSRLPTNPRPITRSEAATTDTQPVFVDRSVVKASITLTAPQRDEDETPVPAPRASSAAQSAPSAGWNKTRIAGHQGAAKSVRLAAHDPLSDPFGDRLAQNEEPQLNPPTNESVIKNTQAPAAPAPRGSAVPAPGTDALPPPMPGAAPADTDSRRYDPEICRKWEAGCDALKETLRSDHITTISLNFTPPYSQPPMEGEDAQAFRQRDLQVAGSREWRSKTGRLLATGRLGNLEFGRVAIVDDAGNEVARLSIRELGKDEICFLTFYWQLPYHCYAEPDLIPRQWVASTFTYQASGLCHKPLYFEEVQLERYGHTAGPFKQPVLSGAHFFANIAVLPYKMAINPPMECQYALGYYRPGSCAPWHIPPVPISVRGALAEAGAWIGGIYIIP